MLWRETQSLPMKAHNGGPGDWAKVREVGSERESKGHSRVSSPCHRNMYVQAHDQRGFEGVRRQNERTFQIEIVTLSSTFCPPCCLSWKPIQDQENARVLLCKSSVNQMLTTKHSKLKKTKQSHLQYALDYTCPI